MLVLIVVKLISVFDDASDFLHFFSKTVNICLEVSDLGLLRCILVLQALICGSKFLKLFLLSCNRGFLSLKCVFELRHMHFLSLFLSLKLLEIGFLFRTLFSLGFVSSIEALDCFLIRLHQRFLFNILGKQHLHLELLRFNLFLLNFDLERLLII